MNSEYVINDDTIAVMAVTDSCCKVYEVDDEFMVNKSINDIIELSCKYYGSSLKGRLDGSKHILGCTYKLPIVINQYKNSIFFTTRSYKSGDTYIICYNNISFYEKVDQRTRIYAPKDKIIMIDERYKIFENHYSRANLLYMKLQLIKNTSIC